MSQGPLCPNLTQKFQKEMSQIANHNFPLVMLLGGLSLHLNHLKMYDLIKYLLSMYLHYIYIYFLNTFLYFT